MFFAIRVQAWEGAAARVRRVSDFCSGLTKSRLFCDPAAHLVCQSESRRSKPSEGHPHNDGNSKSQFSSGATLAAGSQPRALLRRR